MSRWVRWAPVLACVFAAGVFACDKDKGGCAKGKTAALTVKAVDQPTTVDRVVSAVLESLPHMTYQVADLETPCAKAAGAKATEVGATMSYVVAGKGYECPKTARTELVKAIETEAGKLMAVRYAVGDECVSCPMRAKELAGSKNVEVKYRLAGFDFDTREQADLAAQRVADAVAKLSKCGAGCGGCENAAAAKEKRGCAKVALAGVPASKSGCGKSAAVASGSKESGCPKAAVTVAVKDGKGCCGGCCGDCCGGKGAAAKGDKEGCCGGCCGECCRKVAAASSAKGGCPKVAAVASAEGKSGCPHAAAVAAKDGEGGAGKSATVASASAKGCCGKSATVTSGKGCATGGCSLSKALAKLFGKDKKESEVRTAGADGDCPCKSLGNHESVQTARLKVRTIVETAGAVYAATHGQAT